MPLSKKARRSSEQPSAAADAICVFVNAGRIDFDRALDLSALESCSRVVRHEGDPASEDELVARVADSGASVVVTKEIPVPASAVERFPSSVRLIVEAGTGYNNIPLPAVKARDITVCNIPAYSSDSVAHLVITFALNWSCGLLAQQRALLASDRSNFEVGALLPPHFELGGKTIGLIGGSGDIGSKVCAIARALGMHVLISSRSPPACMISWRSPPASGEEGVEYTASVDDLLRRSDIVSLHCPLNAETRRLIDARALGLMKRDGYLINTARARPGRSAREDGSPAPAERACARA